MEAKLSDQINESNWRTTLNRHIYSGFCSDLLPPKVETDSGFSFRIAWKNIKQDYISTSDRELLFLLLHNKLPVRERLFRIQQAVDPYCTWCLEQNVAVECDVDHFFTTCSRINWIWNGLRDLIKSLLGCSVSDSNLIRLNMSVQRCPGVVWLVGAYASKVWFNGECEVSRDELFGFLKFKFKLLKLGTSSQIQHVMSFLQ